ncbi:MULTISPECIES: hypothetical protein [unclassified Leuconostoc]|uniref:hypothetical protein n=1 Tax=unclassified Leuconostoc TaxID=2685106 RepID=UPI001903BEB4|nr:MULTISPECIES: hypothetical protein [unclassified Leuconostoc]MBK0040787.1 hypothetical protein [Leuconostoc sp. S51]MBK0051791.1 hypothetical protein [Leuconostoc sp. S50]
MTMTYRPQSLTVSLKIKYSSHGIAIYPNLARDMLSDKKWRHRLERRFLFITNSQEKVSEQYSDWYFGYLIDAYIKTHYQVSNITYSSSISSELLAKLQKAQTKKCH